MVWPAGSDHPCPVRARLGVRENGGTGCRRWRSDVAASDSTTRAAMTKPKEFLTAALPILIPLPLMWRCDGPRDARCNPEQANGTNTLTTSCASECAGRKRDDDNSIPYKQTEPAAPSTPSLPTPVTSPLPLFYCHQSSRQWYTIPPPQWPTFSAPLTAPLWPRQVDQ